MTTDRAGKRLIFLNPFFEAESFIDRIGLAIETFHENFGCLPKLLIIPPADYARLILEGDQENNLQTLVIFNSIQVFDSNQAQGLNYLY